MEKSSLIYMGTLFVSTPKMKVLQLQLVPSQCSLFSFRSSGKFSFRSSGTFGTLGKFATFGTLGKLATFGILAPSFSSFVSFSRPYSTGQEKRKVNNMLGNILNSLYINNINKEYISNQESQKAIEGLVFDQYAELFKDYKGYTVAGINVYSLSSKIKKFMLDKSTELNTKIMDLKNFSLDNSFGKKKWDKEISPVINDLDVDFIYNLCLLHFIIISSYQNSEEKEKFYSINVAMDIGRKMIRKYLFCLKCKDNDFKDASYSY